MCPRVHDARRSLNIFWHNELPLVSTPHAHITVDVVQSRNEFRTLFGFGLSESLSLSLSGIYWNERHANAVQYLYSDLLEIRPSLLPSTIGPPRVHQRQQERKDAMRQNGCLNLVLFALFLLRLSLNDLWRIHKILKRRFGFVSLLAIHFFPLSVRLITLHYSRF